jgi:hypothetical protein
MLVTAVYAIGHILLDSSFHLHLCTDQILMNVNKVPQEVDTASIA